MKKIINKLMLSSFLGFSISSYAVNNGLRQRIQERYSLPAQNDQNAQWNKKQIAKDAMVTCAACGCFYMDLQGRLEPRIDIADCIVCIMSTYPDQCVGYRSYTVSTEQACVEAASCCSCQLLCLKLGSDCLKRLTR